MRYLKPLSSILKIFAHPTKEEEDSDAEAHSTPLELYTGRDDSSQQTFRWCEWTRCRRYLIFWALLSKMMSNQMMGHELVTNAEYRRQDNVPRKMTVGPIHFEAFVMAVVSTPYKTCLDVTVNNTCFPLPFIFIEFSFPG